MTILSQYTNTYLNQCIYEHKKQKLAPRKVSYFRIVRNVLIVISIISVLLLMGTLDYYYFSPGAEMIDAFHNASMILSGMGPTQKTELTFSGKIFSSLYAIFSGVLFVTSIGYILAPGVHRFFHKMHFEE